MDHCNVSHDNFDMYKDFEVIDKGMFNAYYNGFCDTVHNIPQNIYF